MKTFRRRFSPWALAIGLVFALAGCPQDPAATNDTIALAEGRVAGGEYTHPGFGWTMKVPAGWRVKTREEIAAVTQKGLDAMQKSADAPIDASGAVQLLALQRDPFNQFTSAAEAFDPAKDGSYAENQDGLVQLLLKTYADAGVKVRHARRDETVGGVKFNVLDVTILAPDGQKVILHQAMYDALFGTRSLTVSLNWNDDAARDALFAAWRGSQFAPPATVPSPAPAAVH